MYDGKSDPRSHVSHYRQMMALWSHHDALMCKVCPFFLDHLRLKWFHKITFGSIESFVQLFKSFVARFVINMRHTKAQVLFSQSERNEMLRNYSRRYWELYNEIDGCSEKLAVVSYELTLTPEEMLWDDLPVDPPI